MRVFRAVSVAVLRPLLCIALLLGTMSSIAAPSISGTSGTWLHGGSVTISGSSFGTKATAAPVIFDNQTAASLSGAGWDGWWPTASDCGSTHNLQYSTGVSSVVMPHARTTKYITGTHCGGVGANNGQNVAYWKNFTKSEGQIIYFSYYHRASPAWTFGGGSPADDNYKTFGYSVAGSIYELPNNWYLSAAANSLDSTTASPQYVTADDDSSWQLPDANGHSWFWGSMINPMAGVASDATRWTKTEVEVKISSTNGAGYVKAWENGSLKVDYVGSTDKYAGTARSIGPGGYYRGYPCATCRRYYADSYFDTTASRVLLCAGSTYSSRGICENQIPTSWSSGSVAVSVNAGRFTDGSTAYLYVCDSAASCNSSGTAITIAAGGGDTTPPVVSGCTPSGQLSNRTSTTMSCTTDESATCKWSATSDVAYASMANTFSTTGGTSHSTTLTGLSGGNSYNRYVRCIDGVSNANTSDTTLGFSVNLPGSPNFRRTQ